jgi:hypothetical protein
VPNGFPLLILVPAFCLDLARQKLEGRVGAWALAAVYGVVWLGTFAAAQWPFANFLMTDGARNWVFGQHYVDYNARPFWGTMRRTFGEYESTSELWRSIGMALAFSIVGSRLALGFGDWMKKIRR